MKKIILLTMIVLGTIIVSCSNDDNTNIDTTEQITVVEIDKNLLTQVEWLKSKYSFVNNKFENVKDIENIPCGMDRITFFENELELLEHFYTSECSNIQPKFDYKTKGNQIFGLIEEYELFYTVMTLNNDRLVILQEVDPSDKKTPVGAKYIKKEYFKYKGNN